MPLYKRSTKRYILFLFSVLLYIISLTQTAFYTEGGAKSSLMVLALGWWNVLIMDPAGLCWFANPLLIIGWFLFFFDRRYVKIFGFLATVIAGAFLLCQEVVVNEGGTPAPIVGYGSGYWCWWASAIILWAGGALVPYKEPEKERL